MVSEIFRQDLFAQTVMEKSCFCWLLRSFFKRGGYSWCNILLKVNSKKIKIHII